MSSDSSSPLGRDNPPHIRLNSNTGDFLDLSPNVQDQQPASRPHTTRQASSRSLTTPSRPGTAPQSVRHATSNNPLFQNALPAKSAELLLPPRRSKTRRYRDDDSQMGGPRSPSASGFNSRRTSWYSEIAGSRDSRYGGPFASPCDDSRAPSRASSDDDGVNKQTVSEKYTILPFAGLLLFPEDVEKDDYLHNPDPNDKEGWITCAELCSKRSIANVGGLLLITLGLLTLFIGYPILYVLD